VCLLGGEPTFCFLTQSVYSNLIQLYTGRPPFTDLTEGATILAVVQSNRPDRPSNEAAISDALWKLVEDCWAQFYEVRPTTSNVAKRLSCLKGPEHEASQLDSDKVLPILMPLFGED
jgi:hypothetical protein